MKKSLLLSGIFASMLFAVACENKFDYYYYTPEEYSVITESLNLPELPPKYAADLPSHLKNIGLSAPTINSDEATLGRVLFYDKKLSSDGTISCASCHKQEIGFADDRAVSVGVESREGTRNSIALSSVANFAAYYGTDLNGSAGIPFFWDNRAGTASAQNIGSMTNPLEMNMQSHEITAAVKSQPYYAPLFNKAFGSTEITTEKVSAAIASFVNAMGSYQSRFDAGANASTSQYGGADYNSHFSSFSAAENRGKELYMTNCASCHSNSFGRPVKLLSNNGLDAVVTDKGVGGISGVSSEVGSFKVPTLRNVAITAPFMHDGRFQTLEQVIDHYSTGIQLSPNLASELRNGNAPKKFNFTSGEKSDLIAFLGTLTDDVFKNDTRFASPFK